MDWINDSCVLEEPNAVDALCALTELSEVNEFNELNASNVLTEMNYSNVLNELSEWPDDRMPPGDRVPPINKTNLDKLDKLPIGGQAPGVLSF